MISTLAYLAGLLATFGVGTAAGVFFSRRHEAERLDLALSLRESGGGLIRQQGIRGRLADAYDTDLEQWEDVARTCEFPLHDYSRREEAC